MFLSRAKERKGNERGREKRSAREFRRNNNNNNKKKSARARALWKLKRKKCAEKWVKVCSKIKKISRAHTSSDNTKTRARRRGKCHFPCPRRRWGRRRGRPGTSRRPFSFFLVLSVVSLSLSLSLLVVGKEMTSNYKSFRVSKKGRKLGKKQRAIYTHTH